MDSTEASGSNDIKVLLLDLNPASGLCNTLRGLLESTGSRRIQLRQEFIGAGRSPVSEISRIIVHFNPRAIFLVLPSNDLERIGTLIESMSAEGSKLPMIAVVEGGRPDEMIGLLKSGVVDFITPPLKAIDVLPRLWRLLEEKSPDQIVMHGLKQRIGLKQLVGESPAFLAEIDKIPLVAGCDASALISGETGTGKELCARAIHYLSIRAGKPFVPVSCGAIPLELVENELFGHARGAFTGAAFSQHGLIQEADGGSLFLDDIDCLPLQAQVKLLRFLQDREYRQLGSTKVHRANVRIVASTNLDLEKAVSEGKFRRDLYYRLNIVSLILIPLRERKEDIPLLASYFLTRYTSEYNRPARDFTPEALEKLVLYEWPGNVRELENVVERAVVFSKQRTIHSADVVIPRFEDAGLQRSFQATKSRVISQFEKSYVQGLLSVHRGNISEAARAARKNRRAFWELIRKHKIDVQRFKSGTG